MDFMVSNKGQTPMLAFPSVATLIMLVCSAQLPTSIKLVRKLDLWDLLSVKIKGLEVDNRFKNWEREIQAGRNKYSPRYAYNSDWDCTSLTSSGKSRSFLFFVHPSQEQPR